MVKLAFDTEGFEDQSKDIAEISTSTTMGTQIAVGVKVRMFARAVKSQSRPAVAVPAWTNISLAAIYGSSSLAANTSGVSATIRQIVIGTIPSLTVDDRGATISLSKSGSPPIKSVLRAS